MFYPRPFGSANMWEKEERIGYIGYNPVHCFRLWWANNKCHISCSYDGSYESNASYFMMLAHDIKGAWWRYGSRSWTFPPTSRYILLPCDRWQQSGRLTKWRLTWKRGWSKSVSLNSSMQKKTASINIHWRVLDVGGDQTADVSTVRRWVVPFSNKWQCKWVPSAGADCYGHGTQALVLCWWKHTANGGGYIERWCFVAEKLLYQITLPQQAEAQA